MDAQMAHEAVYCRRQPFTPRARASWEKLPKVAMDVEGMLNEATLQDRSLIISLSDHLIFELLHQLAIADVARLSAACSGTREAIANLIPTLWRARSHPPGTTLRLAQRRERALLHEDWRDLSQWQLGPSAPPASRRGYHFLDVQAATASAASSSAPCASLAIASSALVPAEIEPGCRARLAGLASVPALNGCTVLVEGPARGLALDALLQSVEGSQSDPRWYVRLLHMIDGGDVPDAQRARDRRLALSLGVQQSNLVLITDRCVHRLHEAPPDRCCAPRTSLHPLHDAAAACQAAPHVSGSWSYVAAGG